MEVERIFKDFKIRILGVILLVLTCFPNIALPEDFALSKIASLSKPWGLSFINDSELLITERTGKIKIVNIYNGEVLEIQHNLNFKNKGLAPLSMPSHSYSGIDSRIVKSGFSSGLEVIYQF